MSVAYGRGPKGKATRLHSLVVRSRGFCENCGETEYAKLQAAHIISRSYNATRTDENAAFCLCWKCHQRFTAWPLEFAEFTIRMIGEQRYLVLRAKAEAGVKSTESFWKGECSRLQALLAEAETDDAA